MDIPIITTEFNLDVPFVEFDVRKQGPPGPAGLGMATEVPTNNGDGTYTFVHTPSVVFIQGLQSLSPRDYTMSGLVLTADPIWIDTAHLNILSLYGANASGGTLQNVIAGPGINITYGDPLNPVIMISSDTIVYSKTIHITSSDILNMVATPIPLIDAPGTGKILFPINAIISLDVATEYTVNTGQFDMILNYGNQGGGNTRTWGYGAYPVLSKNFLHNNIAVLGLFSSSLASGGSILRTDIENLPLTLTQAPNASVEYADGTSSADITILYRIISIP